MSASLTLADKAMSIIRSSSDEESLKKACELIDKAAEKASCCKDYIQTGLAYQRAGLSEKALENLSKACDADAKNPAAKLFAALAASDLQKYAEAQSFLDDLKTVCPENQAAPTLQALIYLNTKEYQKALDILFPKEGKFDLTVSSDILTRFAEAAERCILPLETADIEEDLTSELELPEKSQAYKDLQKIIGRDKKTEDTDNKKSDTAEAEKTAADSEADADTAAEKIESEPESKEGSDTSKEASKSGSSILSIFDTQASALASKGSRALQKAWNMPPKKRIQQIETALKDLRAAYEKNPHIQQLAYDLGEALLGLTEYGHTAGTKISAKDLETLNEAEQAFAAALKENTENAYTLHYIGRVAFFKRQYLKASQAWKLALKYFEKLPESEYGLAQTYILKNEAAKARIHINRALSSDLQLLRDRLDDLKEFISREYSEKSEDLASQAK